ncbi:MAG: hypothetical protein K1X94_16490 [Sandaracinaceae bacterium]|nr:hypothetical protein [Sandaracinaceae bacterium]
MTTPCPTCKFAVPDGAVKCPQCGRVFGEANRCPHCHAIASARPSGDGFVCVACGKPRKLEPGTSVAGVSPGPEGLVAPRRRGLRVLGGLALAMAVLGAATATTIFGTGGLGIAMAIAIAAVFAATGVRLLKRAGELERVVDDHLARNKAEQAKQILLERTSTIPELAKELGTSESEADAIASKLAAEEKHGIHAELDEHAGVVRFGRKSTVPPVRVEPPADDHDGTEDEARDDEARRAERERRT